MYEAFYGFSEKPFSLLPDPYFLYLGEEHNRAFSMLEYGLLNQAGFTVITGEVGSGKTTLIRHLLNQIEDDILVGLLSYTHPQGSELLQWILLAFGQDYKDQDKVSLFDIFTQFLIEQYAQNKTTVLIIDEAQNLEPAVLEELRMLSNINADKHQVLQLILVGQPQLRDMLKHPAFLQFSQRVSSDYHLSSLGKEETWKYIRHRTHLAGREKELFTKGASDLIYEASKGIPRIVNVLCDTALVYGFADEEKWIEPAVIKNVLKDRADNGLLKFESEEQLMHPNTQSVLYEEEKKKMTPFNKEMAKQLFTKLRD